MRVDRVAAFCLGAMLASTALADEPQSRGAVGIQVSQNNSTTVALGANATFTGQTDSVLHYQEVDLNMKGGPSNAPGTLYFEFSPDGTNWDVSIPLSLSNPNSLLPIPLRIVLPYFRIRYANGAVAQTYFRLTVVYHNISGARLTRFPFQAIDPNEPTEVTHGLVAGQRADGTYANVVLDTANRFSVSVANLPGTQPVSAASLPLPSNAAQESGGNLASVVSNQTSGSQKTQVTNFPTTQAVSGSVSVTSLPVQPEYIADGANPARRATVTAFNALKVDGSGRIQPITGTVKEQKDTGRVYVAFTATGIAGVAADTLMSMTVTRQGVQAAATVTGYTVPTGRVLRCENMTLCARTGAAAANWSRWELRNDPTGVGAVTAPIVAPLDAEPVAATTGLGSSCANTWWPEGVEFSGDGKNMLVFTHNGAATTNVETGSIQCYEYTPLP